MRSSLRTFDDEEHGSNAPCAERIAIAYFWRTSFYHQHASFGDRAMQGWHFGPLALLECKTFCTARGLDPRDQGRVASA